jgi:RNA recognition motif-containing protein
VQRCGKVCKVTIPLDGDSQVKGFAYVKFEFEDSVTRALRLRPTQLGGRPVRRVKRVVNRPLKVSTQKVCHPLTPEKDIDIKGGPVVSSNAVADEPGVSRVDSARVDSAPVDSARVDSVRVDSARVDSLRQREEATRLSDGISSVSIARSPAHPHAAPESSSAPTVSPLSPTMREPTNSMPKSQTFLTSTQELYTPEQQQPQQDKEQSKQPDTGQGEMQDTVRHEQMDKKQSEDPLRANPQAAVADSVPFVASPNCDDKAQENERQIATLQPDSMEVCLLDKQGSADALISCIYACRQRLNHS